MDRTFANVVDQIALAGPSGISLLRAAHPVLGPNPDPAILAWLSVQLRTRSQALFSSPDWTATPHALHVVASEPLRRRALGFNADEHPDLQHQAWHMLEHIARAGPDGVLQSELSPALALTSVMVHHYLGSLLTRQLVAKKKVVLTRTKRTPAKTPRHTDPSVAARAAAAAADAAAATPTVRSLSATNTDEPTPGTPSVTVTYTAVVVLARFAADIVNASASKKATSLSEVGATPSQSGPAEPDDSSVSIIDLTRDIRMKRILDELRDCDARAERDLKIICMPDAEQHDEIAPDLFRRRRHRTYRGLRAKLQKMGLVQVVSRPCRNQSGKSIGLQPCLTLTALGRDHASANGRSSANGRPNAACKTDLLDTQGLPGRTPEKEKAPASSALPRMLHPVLEKCDGAQYLAEVDPVEQVYQLLVKSGSRGISVPEIDAYLDAGSGLTGAVQKRIRNILNAISRKDPTHESQLFDGKTMFVRVALARLVKPSAADGSVPNTPTGDNNEPLTKRRKVGITSLGEQRQAIILRLLQEKRVVVLETLGREIAREEKLGLVRVDQKVMRRIVDDLVMQKKIKIISATKPSIKESKRWQTIKIAAAPDIHEHSKEVRKLISNVVEKVLYGTPDEPRERPKEEPELQNIEHINNDTDEITPRDDGNRAAGLVPSVLFQDPITPTAFDNANSGLIQGCQIELPNSHDANVVVDPQADAVGTVTGPSIVVRTAGDTSPGAMVVSSVVVPPVIHPAVVPPVIAPPVVAPTVVPDDDCEIVAVTTVADLITSDQGVTSGYRRNSSRTAPKRATPAPSKKSARVSLSSKDNETNRAKGSKEANAAADNSVCVQTSVRDARKARIGRLRAVDYGWMKGKMARARLFHKVLYTMTQTNQSDPNENNTAKANDDPRRAMETQPIPLDEARKLLSIGKFTIYSCLREMTVAEYAATVGVCRDHGDRLDSIRDTRIEEVLDIVGDELMTDQASRRIKSLVQTLTRLGLIVSQEDSQWTLSGAGVIRDFGKGLPPGVVPHGIPFTSRKGVDVYWKILRQFSNFKAPRGQKRTFSKAGTDNRDTYPIRDIYLPVSWDTGVNWDFTLYEVLLYESILQRLCGVDVSLDNMNQLSTESFIPTPLRRFTVEELVDEMDRITKTFEERKRRQNATTATEGLLRYARSRSENNIPKKLLQQREGFGGSKITDVIETSNSNFENRNSSVFRLTRKGSSVEAVEVFRAVSSVVKSEEKRNSKTTIKSKAKETQVKETIIEDTKMLPLLRELIRRRSTSYCRSDSEGLDWKKVPALVQMEFRVNVGFAGMTQDGENDEGRATAALRAMCECALVQAAFDILALQVVLRAQARVSASGDESNGESARDALAFKASQVVNEWGELDALTCALLSEVKEDVWQMSKVRFKSSGSAMTGDTMSRREMLENYFEVSQLRLGPELSLTQMVTALASRYRKVADLRLRSNVVHALLLSNTPGNDEGDEAKDSHAPDGTDGNRREGSEVVAVMSGDGGGTAEDEATRSAPNDESGEKAATTPVSPKRMMATIEEQGASTSCGRIRPRLDSTVMSSCKQRVRVEVAELLIGAVIRQDRFTQWGDETRSLLKTVNEKDLLDARDRLLLRGALAIQDDWDGRRRYLKAVHPEKSADMLGYIREEGGATKEREWIDGMKDDEAKNKAGSITNAMIHKDLLDLKGMSTLAAHTLARLTILDGEDACLDLLPTLQTMGKKRKRQLEEDKRKRKQAKSKAKNKAKKKQGDKGRGGEPDNDDKNSSEDEKEECVVRFKVNEDKEKVNEAKWTGCNSSVGDDDQGEQSEAVDDLADWLSTWISQRGWCGASLEEVVQACRKTRLDNSCEVIVKAVRQLRKRGCVRRVAVESGERSWEMAGGTLLIGREHCQTLRRSDGWVSAWTDVNGALDVELVREVATGAVEMISRQPGVEMARVVFVMCERFGTLSRSAVADLMFALGRAGVLRSRVLVREGIKWVRRKCEVEDLDEGGVRFHGTEAKMFVSLNVTRVGRGRDWIGSDEDVARMVREIA